jgi:hypothetical protein
VRTSMTQGRSPDQEGTAEFVVGHVRHVVAAARVPHLHRHLSLSVDWERIRLYTVADLTSVGHTQARANGLLSLPP